tara:strand:- start:910 stop:1284 length:375 start_codon:yes stop_codon:yes gene_type:complete
MSLITIELSFGAINVSAQVGDIVYFTSPGTVLGGFNQTSLNHTKMLGPITGISGSTIQVEYDDQKYAPAPTDIPSDNDFISFAKDKRINTSSLLGYYANVNFVNDSRGKIELFSVGSEIAESSK